MSPHKTLDLFDPADLAPIGTAGALLAAAGLAEGVELGELLSVSRRAACVRARRRVAVQLRELGWSYPRIGRVLLRHHTTIMALVRPYLARRDGIDV